MGTIVIPIAWFATAVVALLSLPILSGALAVRRRGKIAPGRFKRESGDAAYTNWRAYQTRWRSVYYFAPVYSVYLYVPKLSGALFALFGYRGEGGFTVYSDTWIGDLPLLQVGRGAYLANQATLGTHVYLSDGTVMVDSVQVAREGRIEHRAMIAPGVKVGQGAEVGLGAAVGIRSRIGERSRICGGCMISHGVSIGAECRIGTASYVGVRARIGFGVTLPDGSSVVSGSVLETQAEAEDYLRTETRALSYRRNELARVFAERVASQS